MWGVLGVCRTPALGVVGVPSYRPKDDLPLIRTDFPAKIKITSVRRGQAGQKNEESSPHSHSCTLKCAGLEGV